MRVNPVSRKLRALPTRRHHRTVAVSELGLLVGATAILVAVVVLLFFEGIVHTVLG